MNAAYENLLTRRSVRKYKSEQITDEELSAVLEAGKYAPTAKGSQSPLMIAVQDKGDIARLSSLNAQIMGTDRHSRARPGREPQRRPGRLSRHGQPHERRARARPRLMLDKPRL